MIRLVYCFERLVETHNGFFQQTLYPLSGMSFAPEAAVPGHEKEW